LFDIIERLTVRYGMIAMRGDVVIAPVVVAIVERLIALVGLRYRVGGRSPSVASLADDTRFVRAFGDVSHELFGISE
jgi:hypothetical protein